MEIKLFVARNCETCHRVEFQLINLLSEKKNIKISVANISKYTGKNMLVVPALFVNNQLFAYGEFNEERLLSFINKQASKNKPS
ncbi:MAG: thioredoxin family protein [Bacteroidetes bacterium]|nr:thioredoxin family protein [Bacteroidota bacterium]